MLCGLICSAHAAAFPLVYFFGARYHQIPFLQPLLRPLLKIIGLQITLSDGLLFVKSVNVLKVSITLEKLGFFPFLLYLFGGLTLLFMTGQRRGRIGKFFLILSGYCAFRFIILFLISIEFNTPVIFWSSMITSLSFLPFPFLLAEFLPIAPCLLSEDISSLINSPPLMKGPRGGENKRGGTEKNSAPFEQNLSRLIRPNFPLNRQSLRFGSIVFACFLFFVLAIGFYDPGIKKQGRILIDEFHSNWERTDEEFNTRLFGKKTDYNFYCLSKYLTNFYSVRKNYQPLDDHTLAGADILILKTPTQEYSDKEVAAILDFVARGGGLFLIGDHTNVFGMSTYLNKIAERFNLHFRYDVTYDLPTYTLSLYRKPQIFPHPAVGQVPVFLFASSCTLSAPLRAASVITGYGLRSHYLDYAQKNFSPAAKEDFDYEFGLFIQSAAVTYQKGRILAFTDSTCFSNFFMFIPGKPELLLGSIEWLNRQNRFGRLNLIFFLLGAGCLFYLLAVWRPKREHLLGILLTAGLAAVVAGILMGHLVNQKNYKYPKAKKDFPRVVMESEHSSFFLPVTRLAEPSDKSFLTFFVWSQRLGYVPCLAPSLESALTRGKILVLIDPVKKFAPNEISALKNYLFHGGAVLLMDNPQNRQSKSNEILPAFDMSIDYQNIVKGVVFDAHSTPVGEIDRACKIEGGHSLLVDPEGNSVLSVQKYGAGMIAVFTASHLFLDKSMGYTNAVPNEYQHWLSEIEFWMLGSLAKKKFLPFSLHLSRR